MSMEKEIKKKLKELDTLELIHYQQDFNKPDREKFYSEEFKKAVRDEICRRGDK